MNENESKDLMVDYLKVLDEYEDTFEELPPIPKCGSYSSIVDLMEEAIIRKQPLTLDEVMEAFENIKTDLV